jgi:hypothetical protein
MIWYMRHPSVTEETLGLIPLMLSDHDPRPAAEQFDMAYGHGGGWRPFVGFTMLPNGNLAYPDDPPAQLLAETTLHADTDRPEVIRFYEHAWVAVIQKDGTFEVCRMD